MAVSAPALAVGSGMSDALRLAVGPCEHCLLRSRTPCRACGFGAPGALDEARAERSPIHARRVAEQIAVFTLPIARMRRAGSYSIYTSVAQDAHICSRSCREGAPTCSVREVVLYSGHGSWLGSLWHSIGFELGVGFELSMGSQLGWRHGARHEGRHQGRRRRIMVRVVASVMCVWSRGMSHHVMQTAKALAAFASPAAVAQRRAGMVAKLPSACRSRAQRCRCTRARWA